MQSMTMLSLCIGTHDFRNIEVTSLSAGEVMVNGSFTNDSTATGVLIIVTGESNVYYHEATRDGGTVRESIVAGLPGGDYNVSVFVVEESGLPFERVATTPKPDTVERSELACSCIRH